MENTPEKTFGFQYEHNGKRYMTDVSAATEAEARERIAAMAAASCVGEITPADRRESQDRP